MGLCELREGLAPGAAAAYQTRPNDLWNQVHGLADWSFNRAARPPIRVPLDLERKKRIDVGESFPGDDDAAPRQPSARQTGTSASRAGSGFHRTETYLMTWRGGAAGIAWGNGVRAMTTPPIPYPFAVLGVQFLIDGATAFDRASWNLWLTQQEQTGAGLITPDGTFLVNDTNIFTPGLSAGQAIIGPQINQSAAGGRGLIAGPAPVATLPHGAGQRLALGIHPLLGVGDTIGIGQIVSAVITIQQLAATTARAVTTVRGRATTTTTRAPTAREPVTKLFDLTAKPIVHLRGRDLPGTKSLDRTKSIVYGPLSIVGSGTEAFGFATGFNVPPPRVQPSPCAAPWRQWGSDPNAPCLPPL